MFSALLENDASQLIEMDTGHSKFTESTEHLNEHILTFCKPFTYSVGFPPVLAYIICPFTQVKDCNTSTTELLSILSQQRQGLEVIMCLG